MTDNQYKRRFRVLGKMAYLYDQVASLAPVAKLKLIVASLLDQATYGDDGEGGLSDEAVLASLDYLNSLSGSINSLCAAIDSMGGTAVQSLVHSMTEAYVRTPAFYTGTDEVVAVPFATLPADTNSATSILEAFGVQMDADGVTVTENGGIKNYVQTMWGIELPSAAVPTYADETYYVGTIVTPDV